MTHTSTEPQLKDIEQALRLAREAYQHEMDAYHPELYKPECDRRPNYQLDRLGDLICLLQNILYAAQQAARRAPVVPETIEQRAEKLKGLQVLIGATAGVPEAIELARSRFVESYGRSPLHDDLAYACLLIEAFGAPAVPQGWKLVPVEPTMEMVTAGDQKAARVTWLHGKADAVPAVYHAMLAAAPQQPDAFQTEDGLMRENPATRT